MLSICVALKNRSRVMVDGRELQLFPNCVKSIVQSAPAETELVVADWNSNDWPLHEWLIEAAAPLAVQVIPMEGSFSRGRGLNKAAQAARGDVFFFTDADCLLCPLVIEQGRCYVREGKVYFPVLYSFDGPDHGGGWWRHSGFGNCIIARQLYEKTNGWPEYSKWGKEDDHFFERVSAIAPVVREEVPGFYHQWHPEDILWKDQYAERNAEEVQEIKQARTAMHELAELIPAGQSIVLVDEARFGVSQFEGRMAHPFLEDDGEYGGPPPDDATAIRELERMRTRGATFVAFAWMSFWWLDYYAEFAAYVRSRFRPVLKNERLWVFDMRPE